MTAGLNTNPAMLQTFKGMATTQAQSRSGAALAHALSEGDQKRIDTAAQDFEAVFLTEMLKPMFNMVEVNETFGGGKGEEVFGDFLVQEYAKMIAKQGGIGLSVHIKAEMIKMQGGNMPVAPAMPNPTANEA